MKKALIFTILPVSLICFQACKPKEAPKAPDQTPAESKTETAPETTASPAPEVKPAAPAVSAAERAAKLGFARHLPADTQSLVTVQNGAQAVQRVKDSGFWTIISEISGNPMLEEDDVLDELDSEQEPEETGDSQEPQIVEEQAEDELTPSKLLGREVTLAFGPGTAKQMGNLVTLQKRINYQRVRLAIKALAEASESGSFNEMFLAAMFGEDFFKGLVSDPQGGPGLLSAMDMPPTYVAFLSTPESKESHLRQVSSSFDMLAMLGEPVSEVELDVLGNKFTGSKISGAKVSEMMSSARDGALEVMEEAVFDQYVETIAKKNFVVLTGLIGDYVVVFLGTSESDCRLVADPGESILAGNTLAFADPYLSKDVFTLVHGDKELVSTLVSASGTFGAIADGVRDGLAETTSLGDTRDIVALLQVVADKEAEFQKLFQSNATGSVAYFEDGFKWESFGGIDYGAIEWNAENRLGSLGASDDVFLFSNLSTPAAFDNAAASYYEAILETTYAIAMKVAEKGGDAESIQPFKQQLALFDQHFRTELINMWKAFSIDMEDGLGRERAWVVDLKGTVPAVPGIPQAVVDKAKFPRLSVIAPVADRSKLVSSWGKINESATRTLTRVSEIAGNPIPMQKPMSTEKDGLTTWFFSFPFFNNDFMPSVTVGDQWFATSTSKVQAQDLIGKAATSESKTKGAVVRINFKALQSYLKDSLPIVKENAAAWNITDEDMNKLSRIPDAMAELDTLEFQCRKEAGTIRTSVHFKTR